MHTYLKTSQFDEVTPVISIIRDSLVDSLHFVSAMNSVFLLRALSLIRYKHYVRRATHVRKRIFYN